MAPDPMLARATEEAYDAIRALNRHLLGSDIPAPLAHEQLGNLKHSGGHGLEQALRHIASGLTNSLQTFDVYEDNVGQGYRADDT